MANNYVFNDSLPVALLKIAALESCQELASKVSDHVIQFRHSDAKEPMRRKENLHYRSYNVDSYLLPCGCPRFGAGEGKAVIGESVHGTDVFVMVDAINYSIPCIVSGYANHMSPDDHFQDLERVIGACISTARKVNVIMPFLHESRQHKRSKHESLNCAMGFEELVAMGVENIITLDTHDPRVQNTIPLTGFDNFMPTYQSVKSLFVYDSNIQIDREHLMIISPDEGAMSRAVYLADNLGMDMDIFYRRRDYSQIIGGRNPIVAREFLGASVEGKTVLIIDDMISSGESILDIYKELKECRAGKVIVYCVFGLFTNGLEKFDEFYIQGYLNYVITINLNYRNQDLSKREWYLEASVNRYMAAIINVLDHGHSISASLSSTGEIQKLVQKYQNGGCEYFQKLV